jgi:hypothetical protein
MVNEPPSGVPSSSVARLKPAVAEAVAGVRTLREGAAEVEACPKDNPAGMY